MMSAKARAANALWPTADNPAMSAPSGVLCLLIGALIAFLTWQANGSGIISLRSSRLERDESPTSFQAVLILRAVLGAVIAGFGVWAILGGPPHG